MSFVELLASWAVTSAVWYAMSRRAATRRANEELAVQRLNAAAAKFTSAHAEAVILDELGRVVIEIRTGNAPAEWWSLIRDDNT